ncbi:hypothetical protein KI655_18755 [Vibrio sp. D404a]|uniref:hypothetical protein n=1 Tax=unclassified Vibrio TaxID=2614977 RepID=UPI002555684D|nr:MULTISPECIES: hypothetical protein [unclassified Vibrio]MDK9739339.1 hypothetical protein [Vibrio sp. D404a]MDK9797626.1 hypothetical protein [Vibrio sp. D449a]
MSSIRIRFNYNTVVMNEHGVTGSNKSLCDNTVAVLTSNGSSKRFTYYPKSDMFSQSYQLPKGEYCVGIYDQGNVFLVLKDGVPMHYPLGDRNENNKPNNVVPIR